MKRAFWIAVFLLGAALAAGCGDYDVTLEVEKPQLTLAGAEFELNGEVLVFSGGACLEGGFGVLTAERITYDRRRQTLRAEQVTGTVQGWRLQAPVLRGGGDGLLLEEPTFSHGDTTIEADAARVLEGSVELTNVSASTPRFRFRAAGGRLAGEVFTAREVWGTPCKCGRALELQAKEAEFAFANGRLYLRRADLRAYGWRLMQQAEMLIETEKPLQVQFPLRLSYGAGWNFGLERLPLAQGGEAFGRWSTHLTLLASGVGGPLYEGKTEQLQLALDYQGAGKKLHFGLKPQRRWQGGAWSSWLEPDVYLVDGPLRFGLGWDRASQTSTAYVLLSQGFTAGPLRAAPFFRLSREAAHAGLAAGASGSLELPAYQTGGWRFSLSAPYLAALYPDAPVYAWGGARLRVSYGDWALLEAGFYRAYGVPRYSYESRGGRESFKFRLGDQLWARAGYSRSARYDLAAGTVSGYDQAYAVFAGWRGSSAVVEAGWRRGLRSDAAGALVKLEQTWSLQASAAGHGGRAEWNQKWTSAGPVRSEVWLTYQPPLPACAGGWRLSPSLGYDLLGGSLSRAGLALDLNDCCFTWTLTYQGVFNATAAATAAGHNLSLGVRIR